MVLGDYYNPEETNKAYGVPSWTRSWKRTIILWDIAK